MLSFGNVGGLRSIQLNNEHKSYFITWVDNDIVCEDFLIKTGGFDKVSLKNTICLVFESAQNILLLVMFEKSVFKPVIAFELLKKDHVAKVHHKTFKQKQDLFNTLVWRKRSKLLSFWIWSDTEVQVLAGLWICIFYSPLLVLLKNIYPNITQNSKNKFFGAKQFEHI